MAASPNYKTDLWVSGIGSVQGRRAQIRKNAAYLELAGESAPYLVLVTLAYRSVGDGRPADDAEQARLDESELRVADALQTDLTALYALAVTSNGTRDLFFFHHAQTTHDAVDAALNAAAPSLPYEITLIYDPEWLPYHGLLATPPELSRERLPGTTTENDERVSKLNFRDQEWTNRKGLLDGVSTYASRNESLVGVAPADAPYAILVSLLFKDVAENGLPAATEERDRLEATQDRIADAMLATYDAYFALTFTSAGTRDLIFFHAAPTNETQVDALLASLQPDVDYGIALRHDPTWFAYHGLYVDKLAPDGRSA